MKVLLYLFMVAALTCCSKEKSPDGTLPPVEPMPQQNGAAKTWLALGDSYTIGQSVPATMRFPAQTIALLRQQGVRIADPVYIAQTGWTTGNLQIAITTQSPAPTYDIVSLLIGVNDQYQRMDTGGYAQRFTQLLKKAIQLAKGNKKGVFVLSIPDYSATPFIPASDKERVSREVDWFNDINNRITENYGVSYTNITPSSREAATNPSLVASDNLHPSGLEYARWAAMLAPKIKSFFN